MLATQFQFKYKVVLKNHIEKFLTVDATDFKVFLTKDSADANDTFELQKFSFIKVSIV